MIRYSYQFLPDIKFGNRLFQVRSVLLSSILSVEVIQMCEADGPLLHTKIEYRDNCKNPTTNH